MQASPLSKLFMRRYQRECEENPDFVFDDKAFDILIPRGSGSIVMTHNKPVLTQKLMPSQHNKLNDDFNAGELESLVLWLTGGPNGMQSEETDVYGVVELKVNLDVGSAIVDVASLSEQDSEESKKKAAKEYQDLQKSLVGATRQAMKEAKELADERVKRAIRITHMNLMRQYETLKQDGKGVYAPSVAEAVGAHILAAELDKAGANRKKMVERLANVMNSTTILT